MHERILLIYTTTGEASATAAAIFGQLDHVFEINGIPWVNCVGAGVDNTSVNLGKRNSVFTHVVERNASVYFMGCPCHIVHNTCMKASEAFTKVQLYYDI